MKKYLILLFSLFVFIPNVFADVSITGENFQRQQINYASDGVKTQNFTTYTEMTINARPYVYNQITTLKSYANSSNWYILSNNTNFNTLSFRTLTRLFSPSSVAVRVQGVKSDGSYVYLTDEINCSLDPIYEISENSGYIVLNHTCNFPTVINGYSNYRILLYVYYVSTIPIAGTSLNSTLLSGVSRWWSFYNTTDNYIINNSINNVNNSINETNDTLKDNSTDDPSGSFTSFKDNIANNGVITQLITMPITLYQRVLNGVSGSCSSYNLGSLYGTNLTLPCINVANYIGSTVWGVIDVLLSGLLIFKISKKMIKVFNHFSTMKEGDVISD